MRKKLFSNAYIISILKKFNVILFGIFSTALLNRYLGPAGKGEYALILSMVNILVVLFNLGINQTYPYFKRKNDKDYFSIFFSLSLVNFIILLVLTALIGLLVSDINVFFIFLLTTFSVFRMQISYFNLVEDIKSHSIITIVSSIIGFIFILVIFVVTDTNLIYAYLAYLIKDIIMIILTILKTNISIKMIKVTPKIWINIIKFGLVPMYTTLLISINYKIDVLILGYMEISFVLIGLYTVGMVLAEYAWMVPDIFKDVMINKTAKKDDIKNMCFSLRISSTIMIFIYLIIIIFGEQIILVLFGSEFISAYAITVVLFIGIYSMTYCKLIGTLYIANGNWGYYSKVLSIVVVCNIIMNFVFIPLYGIYGAAGSTVLSYSIAGFSFLLHFKRSYNLKLRDLIFINKYDLKLIFTVFFALVGKKS